MERFSFYLFGEGGKPFYNEDDPLTEIHVVGKFNWREEISINWVFIIQLKGDLIDALRRHEFRRHDSSVRMGWIWNFEKL